MFLAIPERLGSDYKGSPRTYPPPGVGTGMCDVPCSIALKKTMLKHPRQREGLKVLEILCYKKDVLLVAQHEGKIRRH